jgi:hypothetical protein
MATRLTDTNLRQYALLGAQARLSQISEEAAAIYRAFPELRSGRTRIAVPSTISEEPASRGRRQRRKRVISAAQRSAVSERMKRYWAERRGQSDAVAASGPEESQPKEKVARKGTGKRSRMSAAARKRISDAQRARWAKFRKARKNA